MNKINKLILSLGVFLFLNNAYSSGLPDDKNNNTAVGFRAATADRAAFDVLANYMVPVKEVVKNPTIRHSPLRVYLRSPVKEEYTDRSGSIVSYDIEYYEVAPSLVKSFFNAVGVNKFLEIFPYDNQSDIAMYSHQQDNNYDIKLEQLLELANNHKLFTRHEVEQTQKLESENQTATKKIDEQEAKLTKLEADLQTQRALIASKEGELLEARNKIDELGRLLASKDAEIESLKQQLASVSTGSALGSFQSANNQGNPS